MANNQITPASIPPEELQIHKLITNIIQLIENAKSKVAIQTNSVVVILYWNIGDIINKEVLGNKRAEYGEQIIANMAIKLTDMYGSGFDRPNLFRMLKFARLFRGNECDTVTPIVMVAHCKDYGN